MPAALALLAVGCIASDATRGARTTDGNSEAAIERTALDLVNASRREHGLPGLARDALLSGIAGEHARDMQTRGYYGHESPGGDDVQDRHDDAGGAEWRLVAENIARCTRACDGPVDEARLRQLHEGWMDSPGHRENILSPGLDSFGFGIASGDNGLYAVQAFSGPGQPSGVEPGDSLAPLSAEAQAEEALRQLNAARSDAGVPPLELAPALSEAVRSTLPGPGDADFDVASTSDVPAALSSQARARWRGIATVYGACGACGTDPSAPDIRFFVSQWLERNGYRAILLDADATHFGFGLAANGEGRKVALASVASGG